MICTGYTKVSSRTSSARPRSAKRSIMSLTTWRTSVSSQRARALLRKAPATRLRWRLCSGSSRPTRTLSPMTMPIVSRIEMFENVVLSRITWDTRSNAYTV